MVPDNGVDVLGCCRRAEELFELYQLCANRKQIETICAGFLRSLDATKLSITGHMYFVPRTYMEQVNVFEDFITLLGGLNDEFSTLKFLAQELQVRADSIFSKIRIPMLQV